MKDQSGFGALPVIALVVVVGLITGCGLVVWRHSHKSSTTASSTQNSNEISKKSSLATSSKASDTNEADNNSANLPSLVPPNTPAPSDTELCGNGTYTGSGDSLSCTYVVNVADVPARLEAYSVQTSPTRIQLYDPINFSYTCSTPGACVDNATHNQDDSATHGGRTDLNISSPTSVTISVPQAAASKYNFQQWIYGHPDGKVTGDGRYSYTLEVDYSGR